MPFLPSATLKSLTILVGMSYITLGSTGLHSWHPNPVFHVRLDGERKGLLENILFCFLRDRWAWHLGYSRNQCGDCPQVVIVLVYQGISLDGVPPLVWSWARGRSCSGCLARAWRPRGASSNGRATRRSEANCGPCGYWRSPLTTAHCPPAHLHTCTLGEAAFCPLWFNVIQGMGLISNSSIASLGSASRKNMV